MQLDNSISLGDVITVVAFIVTLYSFHIKNIERLAKLELKVETIWDTLRLRFGIHEPED